MIDWYSFTPQDTLYFRGAEPANMGESHTSSMTFPPPAHTIAGALRTAAIIQNGIAFEDYKIGKCPQEITKCIGKAGEASPFSILGPFFREEDTVWFPCPFLWFSEKKEKEDSKAGLRKIIISSPVQTSTLIKTSNGPNLFWAKGKNLETLGGYWVSADELFASTKEKNIRRSRDLFVSETHTGIALDVKDKRRTARKGHLYSFVHARLCKGVRLVFGVTARLPMKDSGVLKLGAEQRFGEYRRIDNISLPQGTSGLFMTTSILAGNKVANQHCVATGRIQYFGGWDLHIGFHKPMRGYFPAGSVFNKKIDEQCIEL
ncbi:CRISPR-associated protein Cmr3 [Syntrophus gentianae]|uniref:CRISPR-associated protein Cmr3 n=1 Tax=Syntrophus gentianae TaxID=43775 RepID=A0A1H7ZK99_9BACT|nr:type III-B CRISPR module-associated Cmr3 family protein [Syntrophus gentianae]SEM58671.1 CRISPR-associated protein Cmr3 [Syntrophus gentianae]